MVFNTGINKTVIKNDSSENNILYVTCHKKNLVHFSNFVLLTYVHDFGVYIELMDFTFFHINSEKR